MTKREAYTNGERLCTSPWSDTDMETARECIRLLSEDRCDKEILAKAGKEDLRNWLRLEMEAAEKALAYEYSEAEFFGEE